jgi:excisionase family DNA binding protein
MTQPNAQNDYYQHRLRDAIYSLRRATPEHFALYLAGILTQHSFTQAVQELKQLQDMFTTLTVVTRGFTLDEVWQYEEKRSQDCSATIGQGEEQDLYLKPEEAAEYLTISKAKVYRYIQDGRLPHVNHGSKQRPRYRVLKSDLRTFRPSQ